MNKKKVIIGIVSIIGTILLGIGVSLVIFKPKYNIELEDIEVVDDTQLPVTFNYYIDNNKVDKMPNNGYKYVSSNCNNDIKISFDENLWKVNISDVNKDNTECNIYFENQIIKRTLTFDYNGGSGSLTSKEIQPGLTYGTLPTPTYDNHYFKGWFTEKNGGDPVYEWKVMDDKDITIYAQYEEIKLLKDILKSSDSTVSEDGNIRFVGANPNNYISFYDYGHEFRIIGLFGNYIKIIESNDSSKYSQWHSKTDKDDPDNNKWESSDLYKYLNNDYYNNLYYNVKKAVIKHDWYVGHASENDDAKTLYTNEQKVKVNAYVGIMSASDYAMASPQKCWNTKISDYGGSCVANNWLHQSYFEWTSTPSSYGSKFALYYNKKGYISEEILTKKYYYRPVLYLNGDVYVINSSKSDGTDKNPYRLQI